MFEESVEGFIARWRHCAVVGHAFARVEGSPLLEVAIGERVLQLFERTGPYGAPTGEVRLIVHAVATAWDSEVSGDAASCTMLTPTRFRLVGPVIERDGPLVVIDAGFLLVVGLDARELAVTWPRVGFTLSCETLAPAHAFVLPAQRARGAGLSPDEQV